MRKTLVLTLLFSLLAAAGAFAHCEIPCGIYDDENTFIKMEEHLTTIEKSINEIIRLSGEKDLNYNQMVRWIMNKEHHADEFQHSVSQYFLTQRVKPADESDKENRALYLKKIALLHEMLIYGAKAKQTTDLKNVEKLRDLLRQFKTLYMKKP
ncbi:MAG: superoxide dismutase [Ni] [Candidatus Eremiobacteraeota bacterium]|nr:superoxide dismutase [Ni] [Candidatus Eremiobacteraeota bacterium]